MVNIDCIVFASDTGELVFDFTIETARENLRETILEGEQRVGVGRAVDVGKELVKAHCVFDIFLQVLYLDDFTSDIFHAFQGGQRLDMLLWVAGRHIPQLEHHLDESFSFVTVVHVGVNFSKRFGHALRQVILFVIGDGQLVNGFDIGSFGVFADKSVLFLGYKIGNEIGFFFSDLDTLGLKILDFTFKVGIGD